MTRRLLFALMLGIGLAAGNASAGTISYNFTINTPDYGAPGWIDFSFAQTNPLDSLSATATISNFQQTGYTLDGVTDTTPGVTGDLSNLPLLIPNDQAGVNYFTQHVLNWGSSFRFTVTFSGPAIGTSASADSAFRLTLYDEDFNFLGSALDNGEIANVFINSDGSLTPTGSVFDGGSATVMSGVPEPGTVSAVFGLVGLALFYRRRQSRA